jgi:hypothetical protein
MQIVKKAIAGFLIGYSLLVPSHARVRGLCAAFGICQSNTSPLGVNLQPGNDYPFLNALWNVSAGLWGFGVTGLNGNLTDLQLDANGWPLSSSVGGSGTVYTDQISVPVQTRPFDSNLTVFCLGTATAQVVGSGSSTVSCPSPTGTAITRSGVSHVNFTGIIPATHLTAFAVVPTQYAAQFLNAGCLTNPAQVACVSPDFIQVEAPFRVLRFMDYDNINLNFSAVSWATRPVVAQPFYNHASTQTYYGGATITQGLPIELKVALCNAVQAACWINIPLAASDDFATGVAAYANANLNQYAYWEYINEPWNNNTLQTQLKNLGATAFSTSASFVAGMSYYEKQADHVMGLITAASSNNKYYRVLGLGSNQNSQGTTCGNCANWWWLGGPAQGNLWSGWSLSHFDVTTVAPYITDAIPAAWGDPNLLGNVFTAVQTGGGLVPSSSGANTTTNTGNDYSLTSSSACGNGAIPATPSNGTITCFKASATSTGNTTLTVDGGTKLPLYWVVSGTNSISSFQLASSPNGTNLVSGTTYYAVYTTTTAAPAWAVGTTYAAKFPVSASDGNTYYSIAAGNVGIDPTTDGGVHWQPLTPAWWNCPSGCGAGSSNGGGMITHTAIPITTQTLATMSALSVSMPLTCYESGEQMVNSGDTFIYYTMSAALADPRWIPAYLQYYAAVKSNGQTGACLHYNDFGWSIFGTWGLNSTMYSGSGLASPSPKLQSVLQYIQQNPKVSLP